MANVLWIPHENMKPLDFWERNFNATITTSVAHAHGHNEQAILLGINTRWSARELSISGFWMRA